MEKQERLAAARFDDLGAGLRELRLFLAQAGVHLRRLADVFGAEFAGVATAGHVLLERRTGLRGGGQGGSGEQQRGNARLKQVFVPARMSIGLPSRLVLRKPKAGDAFYRLNDIHSRALIHHRRARTWA